MRAEGQRFVRAREFTHAQDRWWLGFPPMEVVADDPRVCRARADGHEVIEVLEIVQTKRHGLIALYRQWVVGPDGVEFTAAPWAPKRSQLRIRAEPRLRQVLNVGKFSEESSERRPAKRPKPPPLASNEEVETLH